MTRAAPVLQLTLAAALLHLVLIQPNHPEALTWGALRLFPLELPAILLLMLAMPVAGVASRALRGALVVALVTLVLVKLADFGTFTAFNRAFSPVLDLHLVDAAWRLGSGTIGTLPAAGVVLAALLALAALAWGLWWALGTWAALRLPRGGATLAGAGAVLAAGIAVAEIGQALRAWALPVQPPGAAFTARVGWERAVQWRAAVADLAEFRRAAQQDPHATATDLFTRIGNRDVLVIFVESYARTSIDNPLYSATHLPRLQAAQAQLAAAGQAVRSGWLTSPISGGQSWLAHGTLASGLNTGNQTRYTAMLGSPRRTLWHLARASGYETVAVGPALQLPWPEADLLGFDRVLNAQALDYRGQPFNWITMPDQFTLAVWEDRLPPRDRPRFVQVALISSHAPWVPVPQMVPWDAVGDGTIFDQWATAGDPPDVVWRDRDRVRDQYRQAIDYALEAVFDYAARRAGPDGPLILVLGDHPPVAFVSQVPGTAVPAHLIGPAHLVEAAAAWGWTPGLIPGPEAPEWPMEDFRDRFIATFSGAAP